MATWNVPDVQLPPHVLREYALLADGERGAVIGPHGDVVWMCAPQWHDDAVFSALIGGPGVYSVTPTDPNMVWGGSYEPRSLIWHSRWVTTDAIIECREALAHPGDPGCAVLLRQVRAVSGHARVRLALDVRAGFGKEPMCDVRLDHDVWEGHSGDQRFRWSGASLAAVRDGSLIQEIELEPGQRHDLVLEIGADLADHPVRAQAAWVATEHAWAKDVSEMSTSLAPRDAELSYAVLRGMTSSSGAMVAAATTGLPERADAGRNYDYRYAWIRDQCYAGQAVGSVGPLPLLDSAVQFVSERVLADGDKLRPAYRIDGLNLPEEHDLDLPGYPGGVAKTGNWVNDQYQLDACGEALLLLASAARHDHLDVQHWDAVQALVTAIEHTWTEPDNGIWELDPKHWAHSRLMCASGLRRIARYAPRQEAAGWVGLADTIVASAASDCVTAGGRWKRAPDDDRVDAALLLPAIRGGVPPDDPRSVATYNAVQADLSQDGYVYRFRQDAGPLQEAEGSFLLCGQLMALAAQQQGDALAAVRWFERSRSACGSPGLFTEEFDVEQRQLRGNFPQAFVHALTLETAHALTRPAGGTS
ncbi:glycoside hydrolase [Flexivirga endophytica]|uniref:Glycoside hydrolase n=1 Tax=Flexivirga endophytica TaxID=1849103 RepID=A0A916WW35_9MICO|nr:glycoside hydrolase family 15 protein [Flexivirga endophytica]GGB35150.1 glycoside hydrolase [Flexivirga endophytica]GHB42984.1 glycoside hydrolase [Flexivirga endophytica]